MKKRGTDRRMNEPEVLKADISLQPALDFSHAIHQLASDRGVDAQTALVGMLLAAYAASTGSPPKTEDECGRIAKALSLKIVELRLGF